MKKTTAKRDEGRMISESRAALDEIVRQGARRMLQEALTEITSCATTRHLRDAVAAAFVPVISEGPLT